MFLGDLVGDAGLSGVQRLAAVDPPLHPPIVEVEQHVGLARRVEQHLPGFLVAVLAAKPLDAVEPEAGVGLDRVRRKRVEQLAGVAAALDHGDARRDLLLLVGRQQLGDAQRSRRRRLVVGIEQPIDARAMDFRREHVPEATEDLRLDCGIQLVVTPRRHDEVARALLVAVLEIDRGKRGLAGAGQGAGCAEECFDRLWAGIGQEQDRLGFLAEVVLTGPVGMREAELLDRIGGAADRAVAIAIPERESARRFVLNLGGRVAPPPRSTSLRLASSPALS